MGGGSGRRTFTCAVAITETPATKASTSASASAPTRMIRPSVRRARRRREGGPPAADDSAITFREAHVVRKLAFGFALLFVWVVVSGYIPSFITYDGTDRIQFGLFRLSLIDDVTHGVTALLALIAALTSLRNSLLFLTAFGFYYALDAIFYLIFGVLSHKAVID